MKAAIHIGAEKEAVKEIHNAIKMILTSSATEKVKIRALDAYIESTRVNGAMITNCVFGDDGTIKKRKHGPYTDD